MTICPRPICPRKRKASYFPSHARGAPWTMRPLDDASLELCALGDVFRPWNAYRHGRKSHQLYGFTWISPGALQNTGRMQPVFLFLAAGTMLVCAFTDEWGQFSQRRRQNLTFIKYYRHINMDDSL
jgi:hypothetical protein